MFLASRAVAVVALIALGTGVAFTLRPASTSGPGADAVVESPSPSPSMVPQEAVYVTGTYRANSSVDGAQSPLPHGGTAVRGDRYVGAVTMSDPRLSGEVTLEYDADVYPQPEASETAFIGWGTIEVANDDGRWVGRSVATDVDAAGHSMVIYEVTGDGAYAGYSAVFFEQEPSLGTFSWTGVIFPGELPPDRSISARSTLDRTCLSMHQMCQYLLTSSYGQDVQPGQRGPRRRARGQVASTGGADPYECGHAGEIAALVGPG